MRAVSVRVHNRPPSLRCHNSPTSVSKMKADVGEGATEGPTMPYHVRGVMRWLLVCAVVDKGILSQQCTGVRPDARWFLLHSLANAVVAGTGLRDVMAVLRRPEDAMTAPVKSWVPCHGCLVIGALSWVLNICLGWCPPHLGIPSCALATPQPLFCHAGPWGAGPRLRAAHQHPQ